MNSKKLMIIEKNIDEIIKTLMMEMKSQRNINELLVNQLIELLSDYREFIIDQSFISKSFMGKLFYMFSTLVFQAQFTKYNTVNMEQIFRLRVSLLEMFKDS